MVPPMSLVVGVDLESFFYDGMRIGQGSNSAHVLLSGTQTCRSSDLAASQAPLRVAALVGEPVVTGFSLATATQKALKDAKLKAHHEMLMLAVSAPIRELQARPLLFVLPDGMGGHCVYIVVPELYALPGDSPMLALNSGTKTTASVTHNFSGHEDWMTPKEVGSDFTLLRRNAAAVAALFQRLQREGNPVVRRSLQQQLDEQGLCRVTPQLAHFTGIATGHLYVLRGCLLHILRLGLWRDFWYWLAEFIARAEGSTAAGGRTAKGNARLQLHEARVSAVRRFSDGFHAVEVIRGPYSKAAKRTGEQIKDGINVFGHALDEDVIRAAPRLEAARLMCELAERIDVASRRTRHSDAYAAAALQLYVRWCQLTVKWFRGVEYHGAGATDATGARSTSTKAAAGAEAFSTSSLEMGALGTAICDGWERYLARIRDAYERSGKRPTWMVIAAKSLYRQQLIGRYVPQLSAPLGRYEPKLFPGAYSANAYVEALGAAGAQCAPSVFPDFTAALGAYAAPGSDPHVLVPAGGANATDAQRSAFAQAAYAYLIRNHGANVTPAPMDHFKCTPRHALEHERGPRCTLDGAISTWPPAIRARITLQVAALQVALQLQHAPVLRECFLHRSVRVDSSFIRGVHISAGDIVAVEVNIVPAAGLGAAGAAAPAAPAPRLAVLCPFDAANTSVATIQALFECADTQFAIVHWFRPCTAQLAGTVRGYETFSPRVVWPAAHGIEVVPLSTITWLVHPLPLFNGDRQGLQHLPDPEYPHAGLRAILLKPRPNPDAP